MADKLTTTVSKETALEIAERLASLPLSQEQLEQLLPQITFLLEGLATLDELDLSDVEPAVVLTMPEGRGNGS